ncbi:hypothetical protein DFH28DRAFT_889475 [Melampsora americana]|nr:hypothetical protein DFH28DRAFT_889475 [Melampsora americana]
MNLQVSGSAYTLRRDCSYHHGTMLINSNVPQLKDFLIPNQGSLKILSIRSFLCKIYPLMNKLIQFELSLEPLIQFDHL